MNLKNVFQFLELVPKVQHEIKEQGEIQFKHIITCLKVISHLLEITRKQMSRGLDKDMKVILDFAQINQNTEDTEYYFLDINKILPILQYRICNEHDLNTCVLKLFNDSLTYIINMLLEYEMMDAFDVFSNLKDAIFAFSNAVVLLETKLFKEAVIHFANDLVKILTSCHFSIDQTNVKIRCIISKIITEIASLPVFEDAVLRLLLRRLKNILSYFEANEDFDCLTCPTVSILEFLLYTSKIILQKSSHFGIHSDSNLIVQFRYTVESINRVLHTKIPNVLKNVLEYID
ncbi:uncharacterized protein LOC115886455 [Sitophilus oryzae]|uniref:Uncharacterized protein LOC115886455 n=1 Tax=Sitophilus oryzae TaxID=7048 RepID=A0A6J2YDM8_SITOR|nr:uncharacterized protein LOC115886455 [Sitophilus oryzae]